MPDRPTIAVLARRGLRRAKLLVGDYRPLMPLFLRLTAEGVGRSITDDTDLVIEGFQRSGTTFTSHAVQAAQPDALVVTNHVHNTAVLRQAIAAKIPTLVVVRPAKSCLPSYIVWDPDIGARTILWEWNHYHKQLPDLVGDITIATFEQVTTDLAGVVARMNADFGTDLVLPPQTVEFRSVVEERIRRSHEDAHPNREASQSVPVPDAGRADELAFWRERIAADRSLDEGFKKADELYTQLAEWSTPDAG